MASQAANDIVMAPAWSQRDFPRRVPGLELWGDLRDPSSYRIGTGVQLLGDKSGNSPVNVWASDGSASNTATSPNVAMTGTKTFSFDVLFPDYTPGSNITLVDKLSGFNGFQIILLTTGVLRFVCGNGTDTANVDSTTGLTLTDYTRGQFQVIWTDGVGASFTQNGVALGSAVGSVRTLTNAAVAMTLWTLCPGVVWSFTCGTYTFNPSAAAKLATSFVAPGTGETWTINTSGGRGARISGARDLIQMTAANQPTPSAGGMLLDGSNDFMKSPDFLLAQPCTVYFIGQQVSWTLADYLWDGGIVNTMGLKQDASTPELKAFAGAATSANTGLAVGALGIICATYNNTASATRINRLPSVTGSIASAANPNGLTLGTAGNGSGSFCSNVLCYGVLVFSGLHNADLQDKIIQWATAYYRPVAPGLAV